MNATTDVPAEVEVYLAAVRATLSDLPAAERDDLLAEVESSLREAAGESGPIGARLGSPQEFALELRSAAGLHEPPAARPRATIRQALGRLATHPRWAAVRSVAGELAPVGWVARGYVVVGALAAITSSGWSTRFPAVPRFGTAQLGVVVVLLGIAASVVLGLRSRVAGPSRRRAAAAVNAACVVLALPVVAHLGNGAVLPPVVVAVPQPFIVPGLVYTGAPVQNIYPYTVGGKLLHDVLLYDGAGNPLEIGRGVSDPNRRILTTSANTSIFNSFPIRYYDPGTVHVAHPNAGPTIRTPHILPTP